MKLWIDDVRPAPSDEYIHIYTVEGAIKYITQFKDEITLISLDHDAGKFYIFGGDYIEILIWMEEKQFIDNWDFSHMVFEIHSGNPVGVQNMRRIIKHCGWTEYEDEYSFF